MDGYHFTRAQLSAMPDPANAHARRGAAFTFDAEAFCSLVQSLREPLVRDSPIIYAPSFDHATKDPKENDIAVLPTHRIAVFEGNYLALDKEPWRTSAKLMDEVWFVQVDFEVARKRLIKRHLASGIAANFEEADARTRRNDLLNGEEIVAHLLKVNETILSTEDNKWL
jgi:pantothenate kinase